MKLTTILTGCFLLLAVYCGLDPFRHSAIVDFPEFEAVKVELVPWSEVPKDKDTENKLVKSEIKFLNEVQGPESVAFDPKGVGPYTGVADGRVVVWNGKSWSDFAYTSPNRSELCDRKPTIMGYIKNEHICGRPLGLRFHKKTGDLYIADAYFGLLKVGPDGGLATPLVTEVEGVHLKFTNDLDIDDDGNVYFTDSSTKYPRRDGDPSPFHSFDLLSLYKSERDLCGQRRKAHLRRASALIKLYEETLGKPTTGQ